MPKREDEAYKTASENYIRTKYCPFCGSIKISYSEHFKSWKCNRCEKSFDIPTYGW